MSCFKNSKRLHTSFDQQPYPKRQRRDAKVKIEKAKRKGTKIFASQRILKGQGSIDSIAFYPQGNSQISVDLVKKGAQGTTPVRFFKSILEFWCFSSQKNMMDIDDISNFDVSVCFETNTACFDVSVETTHHPKRKWVDDNSTSQFNWTDLGSYKKNQNIAKSPIHVLNCIINPVHLKRVRDSGVELIESEHDESSKGNLSKRFKKSSCSTDSTVMPQMKEECMGRPLDLFQISLQVTHLSYSGDVFEPELNYGFFGLVPVVDHITSSCCFLPKIMWFMDHYAKINIVYDYSTAPFLLQFMTGWIEGLFPFDPGSIWLLIDRKKDNMGNNYTFNSISLDITRVFSLRLKDSQNGFINCAGSNVSVQSVDKCFSLLMAGVLLSCTKNFLSSRSSFGDLKIFWIYRDTDHEFIAHLVCSCLQRLSIWFLLVFPKHHHDPLMRSYQTCAQATNNHQLFSHFCSPGRYQDKEKTVLVDGSFAAQETSSFKCCNKLPLSLFYAMFYVLSVKTLFVRALLAIKACMLL